MNTLEASGELMVTILASIAQQESASISQNVRMGINFGFQEGRGRVNFSSFLGYRRGDKAGTYEIVPAEADVVRRIYRQFLEGYSLKMIADGLMEDGICTPSGGEKWYPSTVASILENEKYAGDLLMQKWYVEDYLTHRCVKNTGDRPQYFVEDAAITDCSVSDSRVTAGGGSDTFSGAVVGYAQSENGEVTTISQIASKNNTVVGGGYGGGVLGSFSNEGTLSMTNCYAVGSNVNAQTYSNVRMGAFLGASQGGNISLTNCFVYSCSVNATSSSGGKAGLFAADTYHGNVSATNTYYYDTNNLPANAESATAKTADEMKSLASTLGDAFTQGSNYPILLHPVNLAVSIEGWAYGEDANEPSVTRNSSGTPTYTYADKGTTDFSATVPSNAGNYTVKATVEKTSTHKAAEATADFTITKANATETTVPTAKTLTANGQAQELVTKGEAEGGEMQYVLGSDATTAPTTGYATSIPTGTNAGTYYVWYKVVGDSNHTDSEAKCVTATIVAKPEEKPSQAPEPEAPAPNTAAPETKEDSPEAEKQIPASILLNSQFHVSWKGTKVQVTWGSVPSADTYEIYAEYCSKKQCEKISTVHGGNKLTFSQLNGKKLNPKKAVKVYVEAYSGGKKLGRTLLGHAAGPKNKQTNAKKVKASKNTYKLKIGKNAKIKAGTVKESKRKKLLGANHSARYRYATSDMSVATVDKKGRIRAVGTGTCYIWVYAQNGRSKKLTVTVQQ